MRNRTIKKQVWLNENEEKLLKEKCYNGLISESDFFRSCITDKTLKEKPDEEFYNILQNLNKIGTNINQVAKKANTYGIVDNYKFDKYYKEILDMKLRLEGKYL